MPKIRELKINLGKQDLKKYYEVVMHYTAKEKRFQIALPDELKRIYVVMDNDTKLGLNVSVGKKGGNYFSGDELQAEYWVSGPTETECENKAIETFGFINDFQIVRREVIIIDFDGRDASHYHRGSWNPEHPEIGMTLGLLYCTETKAGATGQVNYTQKKQQRVSYLNNDTEVVYEHINLGSGVLAIDDTKENRAFLENTYTLLFNLREKMITHFINADAVLELISSNQKLLA